MSLEVECALGEFEVVAELLHEARRLRAGGRPCTADTRLRQVERMWPDVEPQVREALLHALGKPAPAAVGACLARIVHEQDAGPRAPEDAA